MANFEKVQLTLGDLPYMGQSQAEWMREFIVAHDVREILELGFYHGKSSAYFAAILEDLGRGHLVTIDNKAARNRDPNIEQVLSGVGLENRVTPIFAERSYTWELGKMIRQSPRPAFDLCYLDGGHTWDATGFGFCLVDVLLKPGGWIIFDDLDWTMEEAMKDRESSPRHWRSASAEERSTPGVRLVFETLVPHLGYTERRTAQGGRWGIAQKPVDGRAPAPHAQGLWSRIAGLSRR